MRKLGIIAGIVVVLLIAIIVIVPLVVDVNHYHGLVQAQLEKALGRPVSFGQMHLSLLPPSVTMDNVSIAESPAFGGGVFASTRAISASVKLLPLLSKDVQIQSLELKDPQVQLIRNQQGVWNFSTLGQQQAAAPPPAPAMPPSQAKPPQPQPAQPAAEKKSGEQGFVLSNLKISNGQVTLDDRQKNFKGVYNNIDATLKGYEPGKAFDMSLAMHLPGPGAELMQLSGTAGPIADNNDMLQTPLDGKLELKEVSLAGVQKALNQPALSEIQGTASGTVSVKNQNGTLASDGSIKLEDGVVRGVKIGYPITLDYKMSDQLKSDLIQIANAKLRLGSTPISLAGTINAGPTPSVVDLKITAKNASLEEAARLASAFGVAFNPGMKVSGELNADLSAKGPATLPQMDGKLSLNNLRISGGDLKQPVDVKGLELTMTPRDIRSNPFTASSGGSSVSAQVALTNYSSPQPAVDATLRTGNANIADLLAMARAYGVSAVEGVNGTGTLSLDVHATGPMKNTSAMTFSGSGKLQNVSVKTRQLAQPLNVHNADLQFTSNSAVLNNLNAGLGQTNATGSMTIRNFDAPQVQFTLNADKVNVIELQQALGTGTPQPQKKASLSLSSFWNLVPRAEAQTRGKAPAHPAASAGPSFVEKMTGGGNVTIGTLIYDQLSLEQVRSTVALDHGIVRLSPITAGLYGGQQVGSITVDLRPTPIAISMNTKLQQVDANKLLSSVSSVKQTLYGLLAGNANTNFRVGSSGEDIARSLNGTVAIDLTKGKLAHVDLLNQLANIGKFAGNALKSPSSTASQPFTDIVQLTGSFNVVNGLAQTNNLKALIPGGSLAGDGAVNLATEGLNMHVMAVLTKELSQQVGGTQIGGFMNTALANRNGELVIPVLVTGTFSNPQFAPDLQKIAQMKLQNLLPTAGNPGGLTSGILGGLLGGRGQQGGQQQQGGIGGILGALAGQQQQQNQQQNPKQPVGQKQPPPQQQQQQQQQNPLGNILNQVLQQQQQKKQPPPK
jgi:uncharacterized protein involved in outer membrane biogenesis